MTVIELIEKLKEFPPDQLVVVDGYEQGYNDLIISKSVIQRYATDKDWAGQYGNINNLITNEIDGPEQIAVVLGR